MARTEADVQAELDGIRSALARPESYVAFADRATTYRSVADLQALERSLLQELTGLQSTTPRSRQTLIVGSKGF